MGREIGVEAFEFAERFITGMATDVKRPPMPSRTPVFAAYPNPIRAGQRLTVQASTAGSYQLVDALGRTVRTAVLNEGQNGMETTGLAPGMYFLRLMDQPATLGAAVLITR